MIEQMGVRFAVKITMLSLHDAAGRIALADWQPLIDCHFVCMNDGCWPMLRLLRSIMGEDKQTNKTCGLQSLDSAKHVIGPRHMRPTFPLSPGPHHHLGQDNNQSSNIISGYDLWPER
jgi:hypothetical protein